jgi:hypothetical protein
MERDIVVEASRYSGLTPKQIFFLAHGRNQQEADFFHHEWLIFGVTNLKVEKFVLTVKARRKDA